MTCAALKLPKLSPLVEGFRMHLEGARSLSPHTVRAYVCDVLQLDRAVTRNGRTLLSVTPEEFAAYFIALETELEPTSRSRRLSGIKAFYRFMVRERALHTSPAKLVARPLI